jgi:hypothetical protein
MGGEGKSAAASGLWMRVCLGALTVLSALWAVHMFSWSMKNNGDYFRVTESTILIQDLAEQVACFRPGDGSATPKSTMGYLFRLVVKGGYGSGLSCVNQAAVFGALALIYLAGVCLCLMQSRHPLVAGLCWAGWALLFAPFFSSLFEEAATLALVPWVFAACSLAFRHGRLMVFTILATLFVYTKAQMVYFVPVFAVLLWPQRARFGVVRLICSLGVIAAFGVYGGMQKGSNAIPNAYNRMFNGLGWSMQGVSAWPVHEFAGRLSHFQTHRAALQATTLQFEPLSMVPLMGSSYWPDGEQLVNGQDRALRDHIVSAIKPKHYLAALVADSTVLPTLVRSAISVTLSSDYDTQYLFAAEGRVPGLFQSGRAQVLAHAGWGLVGVFVILWIRQSLSLGLVSLLLAMPCFVVLGDGYYEFEKHMLTYLMALPLFGLSTLVKEQVSAGQVQASGAPA